jgi:F-type H+-transporting ATPase subunit gamma
MAATLRELRGRIRSAGSIKKITKAQELIATSRIAKAQARVEAARPYSAEITTMLTDLAAESALDHPLLVARQNPKRAAVLVVSSDRGLCGAYNANVLRRAEELIALLREEGKEPVLYVVGRKALGYFTFRNWTVTESWIGFSDRPTYEQCQEIAGALVTAFLAGEDDEGEGPGADGIVGVDELHIVFTEFRSMLSQFAEARRIAPMGTPVHTPCSPSSRMPPRCSSRCCRGMWRPESSPPCSKRRHRSRPHADGR